MRRKAGETAEEINHFVSKRAPQHQFQKHYKRDKNLEDLHLLGRFWGKRLSVF